MASYTEILEQAKMALAAGLWDSFFISSVQNRQDMRTTYTKLGNVTAFIDWLEKKAREETSETGTSFNFFVGGT